jgi:hypothetical protein
MKNTGYIDWLIDSFPKCEIIELSDMITESISVMQLFISPREGRCQIAKANDNCIPIICSDQDLFFDSYDNFECGPQEARLTDGDIFYEIGDPSTAAIFIDNSPEVKTYAQDGIMILRLKDKSKAQFLVWYLTLEHVSLEITNNHSSEGCNIGKLKVPMAEYLNDDLFVKLLKDTANEENRIIRNAEHMLERLRAIRESVAHEMQDTLKSKSMKK